MDRPAGEPVSGHRETLGRHRAGSTAHSGPVVSGDKTPGRIDNRPGDHRRGAPRPDQRPFDMRDPETATHRLPRASIPRTPSPKAGVTITHDYYDHRGAERDLERRAAGGPAWREMRQGGRGHRGGRPSAATSFMGHMAGRPRVETLVGRTAPQAAGLLRGKTSADAVVLTPGVRDLPSIRRVPIQRGDRTAAAFPTVGLSLSRAFTEKVRPPRTVHTQRPLGRALGAPFDVRGQTATLQRLLDGLGEIAEPGCIVDL